MRVGGIGRIAAWGAAILLFAAGVALLALSLAPPAPLPPRIAVEILATGERNATGKGQEVWVRLIGAGTTAAEAAGHADPPGGFREINGVLVAGGVPPATLRLDLPSGARLEFVRHPWSGIVRVSALGHARSFDLFAEPSLPTLIVALDALQTHASLIDRLRADRVAQWLAGLVGIGLGGLLGAWLLGGGRGARIALAALGALVLALGAARVPLFVTPDGIEYLHSAIAVLAGEGAAGVTPLKAPLLTLLTALVVALDPGLTLFVWLHAAAIGLAGLLVWRVLLPEVGRGMAIAAGLLLALHPVLLTYQSLLLREALATTCIAVIAWLVLRLEGAARPAVAGLLLGVACGIAALLRENFVALVLLVPLIVLATAVAERADKARLRGRLAAGVMALLGALILVVPWMAFNQARTGFFAMTVPKTQFNALINAFEAGLLPGTRDPAQRHGSYGYVARLLAAEGVISQEALATRPVQSVVEAQLDDPRSVEAVSRRALDRALEGQWQAATQARIETFLLHAGLRSDPRTAANPYYARARRGQPLEDSNYLVQQPVQLAAPRYQAHRAELERVIAASRVPSAAFRPAIPTPVFDMAYRAYGWIDQAMSVAFLAGLFVAARRGRWLLFGVGAIAVANWLGAAWLIAGVDRFAVPFLPIRFLLGMLALHAVALWCLRPVGAVLERARRRR